MKNCIIVGTLIIAVISLFMNILLWIKLNIQKKKRKMLRNDVEIIRQDVTRYLLEHHNRLTKLENKAKQNSYAPQQTAQQAQEPILKPSQQPTQQPTVQSEKNNKHGKLNKFNKQQHPNVIKTIYLDLNSSDFFPENQISEQKSETSKFVASLTSESEGTYVPIDVERIRSADILDSVKQSGLVAVKDAHSFNVIEPGKIKKEDNVWVIKSPVVVEYYK